MRRWLTAGALGLLVGWGQTARAQEPAQTMPALTASTEHGAAAGNITPVRADVSAGCHDGIGPHCGHGNCRRGFLQRLRDWLTYRAERAGYGCRGCAPRCEAGCWPPPVAYLYNRYDHGPVHATVPPVPTQPGAEAQPVTPIPVPQPYPPAPFTATPFATTPTPSAQPTTPEEPPQRVVPHQPGVLQLPPLTPPSRQP
jgi:hypothetical protein